MKLKRYTIYCIMSVVYDISRFIHGSRRESDEKFREATDYTVPDSERVYILYSRM